MKWTGKLSLPLVLVATLFSATAPPAAKAQQKKPNIVIIWGDDIGQSNVSAYSMGMMGYRTPNIDRVASEGIIFTDYYAEQSCTAGRSAFITGQSGFRTGLPRWGFPGATVGCKRRTRPSQSCSRRRAMPRDSSAKIT